MKTVTPLNSFLNNYAESGISRFHMPGHKGISLHGLEAVDITEIENADHLYQAEGVIGESERLTAAAYGSSQTLYSTEGSSLSIKTMLALALRQHIQKGGKGRLKILAARNCHRAFINGCILLDIEPIWVYSSKAEVSLCACQIAAEDIRRALENAPGCGAVYITSPDYLGNMTDIKAIAEICRVKGIPLLVDNAHGAYLKFAGEGLHPLEQEADMCADSAHKTLPVYTGGGYLHISKAAPEVFVQYAKREMSVFASTSPSYLIMGSLDMCAGELHGALPVRIRLCCERVRLAKKRISAAGWEIGSGEPMKITIYPNSRGYTGEALADLLRSRKIECEYADISALVLMPSPYNSEEDFVRLEMALEEIPLRERIAAPFFELPVAEKAMSLREAAFSPCEEVAVEKAVGRICASAAVSCQPSVPIIMGGEIFTEKIIKILKSYSIFNVNVIK